MYDRDDEEEIFLPEDEFSAGDDIVLWTTAAGVELGYLLGFSDHGLIWRRTHKTVKTGDGEDDWEFENLNRSILTFSRWDTIERLESHAEIQEEHQIGKFSELLEDVKDSSDFAAVVQAAAEDTEDSDD